MLAGSGLLTAALWTHHVVEHRPELRAWVILGADAALAQHGPPQLARFVLDQQPLGDEVHDLRESLSPELNGSLHKRSQVVVLRTM